MPNVDRILAGPLVAAALLATALVAAPAAASPTHHQIVVDALGVTAPPGWSCTYGWTGSYAEGRCTYSISSVECRNLAVGSFVAASVTSPVAILDASATCEFHNSGGTTAAGVACMALTPENDPAMWWSTPVLSSTCSSSISGFVGSATTLVVVCRGDPHGTQPAAWHVECDLDTVP